MFRYSDRLLRHVCPFFATGVLAILLAPRADATSWGPREDVGVAAVDTRTGKVLWEAWRLDEVPAGASNEEKTVVEYLLAAIERPRKPLPLVTQLPDLSVEDLVIKDPWPPWIDVPAPAASQGKSLVYYRHARGVIALNRQTGEESWRVETTRGPYRSCVLEAEENQAFIQIGSDVPVTIRTVLVGDRLRLRGLEPHTLQQRTAAAVLLRYYGDGYFRPEVQKLVEELDAEKSDPNATTVAKTVEKLLADWPKQRNRQRLLDGCVAALIEADEGNPFQGFAWPEASRVLTWCLLQEFIYGSPRDGYSRQGYNYAYDGWNEQRVSLSDATRKKLTDQCRKVVADGPDAERPFAASVLVSSAVGWANLTEVERKKLFLSSDPSAWRWAALALVKNGLRKELIEWAGERPVDDHLDVVFVLEHNKPNEWSDAELKFWLELAHHKPGSIAYVLRSWSGPTPVVLREPIRAYLKREIAEPTVKSGGTQPAYDLSAAVQVLDAWKDPGDTSLLLDYLKYPVQELRAQVRHILEQRGIKVPPSVGYEK